MTTDRDSYITEHFEQLIDAFTAIELETILEGLANQGCLYLSLPLLEAANEAKNTNNRLHFTSLELLHEICEKSPYPNQPNNPFDDNFSDIEINFFAEIASQVSNPFLKGRLADRVWSSRKYRKIEYARLAIDSYMNIPLDANTWLGGGDMYWHRAISLCLSIGKGAENRLRQIRHSIRTAFDESTTERGLYAIHLSNALKAADVSDEDSPDIASKLESLAQEFDTAQNFHASGKYYNATIYWFEKSGMTEKAIDMMAKEANAFENEAMAKISTDDPSHMAALPDLKNALATLYQIPNEYKERHNTNEKIRDLELRISKYGRLALTEMATYTTPGIDVSETIRQARKIVAGKPVVEAFAEFVNLHRIDVSNLRKLAEESIADHPIHRIFHTIQFESDGRIGGTIPGYSESASSKEKDKVVSAEMFQFHYAFTVSIVVQSMILPALYVLNREHCLQESDFTNLASQSPAVPTGREELWGKVLFQGFNYDFITSIHLMAPQIEHLVRYHLKANKVRTTFTDFKSGGKETEYGLCTLMESPEINSVFDPNWTYEINTLFCGPTGWNLRNEVAHGLLVGPQLNSVELVYAWWFGLKLILNCTLSAQKPQTP